MRQDARSGRDGLAGMSAIREIDGCRILRPLLDVPKARLLATLAAEGQPFICDPSNRNPIFARTRLRERTAGPDLGPALEDIRRLGHERAMREQRCNALLARAGALHPAGFAVLDPEVFLAAPPDVAEPLLSALVSALGGRLYPPRRRAVARLLLVLAAAAPGGHVLGGCRFIAWRARVLILRELAAAAAKVPVEPGTSLLWDRRFRIRLPAAAGPLRRWISGPGRSCRVASASAARAERLAAGAGSSDFAGAVG